MEQLLLKWTCSAVCSESSDPMQIRLVRPSAWRQISVQKHRICLVLSGSESTFFSLDDCIILTQSLNCLNAQVEFWWNWPWSHSVGEGFAQHQRHYWMHFPILGTKMRDLLQAAGIGCTESKKCCESATASWKECIQLPDLYLKCWHMCFLQWVGLRIQRRF